MRAWVAGPESDQRELGREGDAERRPTEGREVVALEQQVEPTTTRPGRPESLEVQDLNLSIGTISIVIEEPKQAPVAIATRPKWDRSPEGTTSEPTRLSRYYLRRW